MSVFPGGYNLGNEFTVKDGVSLETRIAALEKRNQTLTGLLEKNTEYLLKEVMLLKAQLGPSKKEEKKEDADIDTIIRRLSEPTTLLKPDEQHKIGYVELQPMPFQPVIHRHSSALSAPTNEIGEPAKKSTEESTLDPYNSGGTLSGWDLDELRPYMEPPTVASTDINELFIGCTLGLTKTESDAASVEHCIGLPMKPISVYESMGITHTDNAFEKGACIRPDTAVYHIAKYKSTATGLKVDTAPVVARADVVALKITKDNIDELNYLGEYTSLQTLDCSNLGLTKLPSILPPKLKKLQCNHNKLTELPDLPKSLRELNFSNNRFNFSGMTFNGNPWDTNILPDEKIANRPWEVSDITPLDVDDMLVKLQSDWESSQTRQKGSQLGSSKERELSHPPSRKRSTPEQKRVVFPTPGNTQRALTVVPKETEIRLIMLPKRLSAIPTSDPLIRACFCRNSAQALELIKNNALIRVDGNGDTALIWACANKMPEVALKLIDALIPHPINHGCFGRVDREGNTALIWACVHNMREVIDALMSTDKANAAHINKRGQTAKMWIEHHKRNFEAEEAKKAAAQPTPNRDGVVEQSTPNRDGVVEQSTPNRDGVVEQSTPNRDVVVEKTREKALTFVLNISSNEALDAAMMAQWRPFKKAYDGHVTYSGYKMGCVETHVPALYPTIAASFSDKPSTRFFESTTEVNQWLNATLPQPTVLEDAKSDDSFVVVTE